MPRHDSKRPASPRPRLAHTPAVRPGQVVALRVADVNQTGVFLDQGQAKQLLLPHTELHERVEVGDIVVVVVLEDERGRRYATSKVTRHLDFMPLDLRPGQKVSLLVYAQHERGYLCVVEGRHAGMLYRDRTHQPVAVGDELEGYVVELQPEGKIDLSLRRPGVDPFSEDLRRVEEALRAEGFLDLHDKSPTEEIQARLGMSKKAFKRAVGALYKRRQVVLEEGGVRWVGAAGED